MTYSPKIGKWKCENMLMIWLLLVFYRNSSPNGFAQGCRLKEGCKFHYFLIKNEKACLELPNPHDRLHFLISLWESLISLSIWKHILRTRFIFFYAHSIYRKANWRIFCYFVTWLLELPEQLLVDSSLDWNLVSSSCLKESLVYCYWPQTPSSLWFWINAVRMTLQDASS